jgi:hypothetical protein
VAEHNLPFSLADHFTKLLPKGWFLINKVGYTLGFWGRLYSSNMSGPLGMSFNIIKGTGSDWKIGITKFTVCQCKWLLQL